MAKEDAKKTSLIVDEVENDAVIVNVAGWRMRVYKTEGNNTYYNPGQAIEVEYQGDLTNPHELKFAKLK